MALIFRLLTKNIGKTLESVHFKWSQTQTVFEPTHPTRRILPNTSRRFLRILRTREIRACPSFRGTQPIRTTIAAMAKPKFWTAASCSQSCWNITRCCGAWSKTSTVWLRCSSKIYLLWLRFTKYKWILIRKQERRRSNEEFTWAVPWSMKFSVFRLLLSVSDISTWLLSHWNEL